MGPDKINKTEKLLDDTHDWEKEFTFKFIYKNEPEILSQLKSLFPVDAVFSIKHSKNKNFQSLNVKAKMKNGKEVLAIYDKARQVKDVISL